MSNECRLTDATGTIVADGTRDQVMSFLKRLSPDGEYAVVGPGIDAKFHKVCGVVHPAGGDVHSKITPARTRDERVTEALRQSALRKADLYDLLEAVGISYVSMYYYGGCEVDGVVECYTEIDFDRPELPPDILDTLNECFADLLPDGWETAEGAYGVINFDVSSGMVNFSHSQEYPHATSKER